MAAPLQTQRAAVAASPAASPTGSIIGYSAAVPIDTEGDFPISTNLPLGQNFVITAVYVVNKGAVSSAGSGGLYTAPNGGGSIVLSSVFFALPTVTQTTVQYTGAGNNVPYYTAPATFYLNTTTALGMTPADAGCIADVYLYGFAIN